MTNENTAKKPLQKISDWLDELDSHGIYDSTKMKEDFERCTGQPAPAWPEYSASETVKAMIARGLGGEHRNTNGHPECWGYIVSGYFARTLANHSTSKMGRGFAHRDNIEAIRKAGF